MRHLVPLKDIAAETGIHRVTLSKLANNKKYNVGVDALEQLCAYFNCALGEVAEYIPDPDESDGQNKPE